MKTFKELRVELLESRRIPMRDRDVSAQTKSANEKRLFSNINVTNLTPEQIELVKEAQSLLQSNNPNDIQKGKQILQSLKDIQGKREAKPTQRAGAGGPATQSMLNHSSRM